MFFLQFFFKCNKSVLNNGLIEEVGGTEITKKMNIYCRNDKLRLFFNIDMNGNGNGNDPNQIHLV